MFYGERATVEETPKQDRDELRDGLAFALDYCTLDAVFRLVADRNGIVEELSDVVGNATDVYVDDPREGNGGLSSFVARTSRFSS